MLLLQDFFLLSLSRISLISKITILTSILTKSSIAYSRVFPRIYRKFSPLQMRPQRSYLQAKPPAEIKPWELLDNSDVAGGAAEVCGRVMRQRGAALPRGKRSVASPVCVVVTLKMWCNAQNLYFHACLHVCEYI